MLLENETGFRLPSINNDGIGLRVDFDWAGDRFRHSVTGIQQDRSQLAWEAQLEQSPVFQHLHQQTDDQGRPVLLLVGAADHIHWSMSVHAANAGTLCFDVAGRVPGEMALESLQNKCLSSYARPAAVEKKSKKVEIVLVTGSDALLHTSGSITTISAEIPPGIKFPCTVRWRYLAKSCVTTTEEL